MPPINIYDFADLISADILITRKPNRLEPYCAGIDECWIWHDGDKSWYQYIGSGLNVEQALNDHTKHISGKKIRIGGVGNINAPHYSVPSLTLIGDSIQTES
jgi:hypothetical protein